MTSAVASYLFRTKHLHCLWHIMKNARKNCQGALKDKAKRFFDSSTLLRSPHRKYWSRCYHPTSLTLNMTASQRVEGIFAVLKR
ncbi:unnamed protein product, partial [Ectocarpus sp. 13 AM-2016]